MHLVATLQSWSPLLTPPPLSAVMARMANASILCRRRVGSTTPTVFAKRAACSMPIFNMRRLMSRAALRLSHATSRDLMTWDYVGAPLLPDEPFDCHGVYSGSALAEDGRIRVLYTGNVKLSDADGTYDYVNTGRRADTVYVESVDGLAGRKFNQKRVVLASEDYPEDLTCHVRDPKVWRDADGRYHMVLGARRRVDGPHVDSRFCAMHGEGAGRDVGEILVYGSADMLSWELESRVSTPERFGFMWECPGYLELEEDGGVPAKWLSFSPRGLEGGRWDRGNVYAAGYMPVTGDITGGNDAYELGEFRLWDAGFDFYAPQEFTAEDGRHILIGWMGMPDEPTYGNAPTVACGWQHCMTVPRELTAGAGGVVLQQPAREIEHHYASVRVGRARWRLPAIPALTLLLTVSTARLPRPLMAS